MVEAATQLTDAEVAAFLRAHPGFLAANPALYRRIAPPARVHGEALSDHMAAMLRLERAHAAAMEDRADGVLAAGRAAAGLAARVHEAVLALIRAADKMDCVLNEFPILLAVDTVSLCAEGIFPGARRLPAGMCAAATLARPVRFRQGCADAMLLYGEAAHLALHEALLLLPGAGPPLLLALAGRDRATLDPSQGTGALAFLGRAVAAALGRA